MQFFSLQGITPSLRKEVWKFLLGFYPWTSTTREREDILRVKTSALFFKLSHSLLWWVYYQLLSNLVYFCETASFLLQGRVLQDEGAVEVGQRRAGDEELAPQRIQEPDRWRFLQNSPSLCSDPQQTMKRENLCFVVTERDVNRTDRHNTFFSGNDNPGLTLLHDVLMTYCMYNFDLGGFYKLQKETVLFLLLT